MADYGMKVTLPGYDVSNATDSQLVYSSKFDTFRVFMSGSGTVTLPDPSTPQTATITHSLGYRPAFAVYSTIFDVFAGEMSTSHYMLPYGDPFGGDGSLEVYVTTTTLVIRYGKDHAPAGSQFNYRYFIYYNRAI